ncbi:MAG: histidine kinase [Burkholderiales bacterium]
MSGDPQAAGRAVAAALARSLRGLTRRRFALFLALVALAAVGHAIAMALMPDKGGVARAAKVFAWEFAYLSLFFGTVWVAVVIAGNLAPARTGPRVLALVAAVAVGLAAGQLLSAGLDALWFPRGKDPASLAKQVAAVVLWSHVIAAGVLGYFFVLREEDAAARLHAEELRRVDLDRELAEARLQVLQAQVEPHFLFNTLANVRRLFRTDAPAARAMIEHLSSYLSALLPRMRSADSTLEHELALATAYLHVQQIRMGDRLAFRIDVPPALATLPFPPMMLVTLVENAIRHGVNPLPRGGEVRITARAGDGRLLLQVADTGRGLSESAGGEGVGLANIRARLTTLYGGAARLLLSQRPGAGVVATIELPLPAQAAGTRAA